MAVHEPLIAQCTLGPVSTCCPDGPGSSGASVLFVDQVLTTHCAVVIWRRKIELFRCQLVRYRDEDGQATGPLRSDPQCSVRSKSSGFRISQGLDRVWLSHFLDVTLDELLYLCKPSVSSSVKWCYFSASFTDLRIKGANRHT